MRLRTAFCTFLTLFAAFAFAQQPLDLALFKGMKPRNIGPAGMSGRVTAIAVVEDDPEIIYAGTASGGLWKSNSGGLTWKPVFDEQPVQSIGAVAVDQRNPSIVWAGTGEGNPRNSHNSGGGIFRSSDGGRSWACMGLKETRTIHRIIVHPDNSDIVWAAALGSPWGPNPDRGVFKTTNGGINWEKVLFANDTTGCADLIIDPKNPDKLYAAMWQYQRWPWFFKSGGSGSGLHVTLDGGKTWQKRTDKHGLPAGELGRIGLAVCHDKPDVVYALVESKQNALYRSDDGGYNWRIQSTNNIGNRPFYYAEIYVDPKNENRVYNLFSIVTVSEDAGKTFKPLLPWSSGIHPDHHAFYVHPHDPDFLVDGNDGGLAISRDRGMTWHFAGNIPVSQFYHVNYDMEKPYNVMGGMQDNGSYVGPSQVWAWDDIRNLHWREVAFGDGFGVMAKPDNADVVYAMSQGGNLLRVNKQTGLTAFIRPAAAKGQNFRFNWNAPLAQDPFDPATIYYGSQFLHRSTDSGDSWAVISPDLTTNDTSKQKQVESGGLTIDATAAENHTTLVSIAPSVLQKGLIWTGSDDGKVFLTRDGGGTWTDVGAKLPAEVKGAWIPWIETSKHDPAEAFVVVNDYRRNNWQPLAFRTTDFGQSWKPVVKGVTGHCLSLAQDPVQRDLLFLGTDEGLFVSLDGGGNWTHWNKDFPAVPVNSVKIHPRDHDLILGTFGRALWILDDIRPLRELSKQGAGYFDKPFDLVSVTDGILAEYRSVDAGRFLGSGEFKGENRRAFPMITLYFPVPQKAKPAAKDKQSDAKPAPKPADKVKFHVLAGSDTIRTWSESPDTGFVRYEWGLHADGEFWFTEGMPKPGEEKQAGFGVRPGEYKLVAVFGTHKDSAMIKVEDDPRLKTTAAEWDQRDRMIDRYYKAHRVSLETSARLGEAKENVNRIHKLLEGVDKKLQDSLTKKGNVILDSISTLTALFRMPGDFKGLDHVTHRLGESVSDAGQYIGDYHGMPGANAEIALSKLEQEVNEIAGRVNRLLEKEWKQYQDTIRAAELPLFKPLEPFPGK